MFAFLGHSWCSLGVISLAFMSLCWRHSALVRDETRTKHVGKGKGGLCFLCVGGKGMRRGPLVCSLHLGSASLLGFWGFYCPGQTLKQQPEEAALSPRALVLTCTFLFRLTAGKNRPSTFSNAMGPCCSLLMKNVNVFLFKSRRTPMVAPFVIPPSVLWEKEEKWSLISSLPFLNLPLSVCRTFLYFCFWYLVPGIDPRASALPLHLSPVLFLLFETGSYQIVQAGLELPPQPRQAWNLAILLLQLPR